VRRIDHLQQRHHRRRVVDDVGQQRRRHRQRRRCAEVHADGAERGHGLVAEAGHREGPGDDEQAHEQDKDGPVDFAQQIARAEFRRRSDAQTFEEFTKRWLEEASHTTQRAVR